MNGSPGDGLAPSVTVAVVCHRGIAVEKGGRTKNEDNFLVAKDGECCVRDGETEARLRQPTVGVLLAVADGMGGHTNGDLASGAAVRSLLHLVRSLPVLEPEQELRRFLLKAHARLQAMARENQASDMGTTVLVAWLLQDEVYWVNVGDSRLYHVRNSALRCVTRDQTRGEFARRDGRPPPTDAEHLAQSFVFGSRGLGHDDEIRIDEGIDTGRFRVRSGDQLVLCTDGLWAFVDDFTILESLRASNDPVENARWLNERAMSLGGDDNITAVVVRFDDVVPVQRQEDPPTHQP
jgi:protein phosphatase